MLTGDRGLPKSILDVDNGGTTTMSYDGYGQLVARSRSSRY